MTSFSIDGVGLFVLIAGFIIGLGAVTVIDIHGFLGRKSHYWTEATTRTHKVTKPLIWIGLVLVSIGGALLYRNTPFIGVPAVHLCIALILVINGMFLSFSVSPYLLKREEEGRGSDVLPDSWQRKIIASFIISFIGWWGGLAVFVQYITTIWKG